MECSFIIKFKDYNRGNSKKKKGDNFKGNWGRPMPGQLTVMQYKKNTLQEKASSSDMCLTGVMATRNATLCVVGKRNIPDSVRILKHGVMGECIEKEWEPSGH